MARARFIHPGFFQNEILAELSPEARLLFAGLWTIADRAGRLEDRPRRIKAEILPWDDVDIDAQLAALSSKGFIDRYVHDAQAVIQIVKFAEHQRPHPRERASVLPEKPGLIRARRRFTKGKPRSVHDITKVVSSNADPDPKSDPDPDPDPNPNDSELRSEPALLTFPCAGKIQEWHLTQRFISEWAVLFPGVDVPVECGHALAWVFANPAKKKTAGGMERFLVSWLTRSTDAGSRPTSRPVNGWRPTTASSKYIVPCPHVPSCENTRTCCYRQDEERLQREA